MFKTKTLTGIIVVLAVLFMQVGTVFAAPVAQETTPITGTIVSVEPSTADADGVTTYLVTVKDEDTGTTQTVRVSQDTAASLGLLQKDPATGELVLDPTTGEPVVDETQSGQPVTIASADVILDEEPDEEPFNPVAGLLADYFGVTNATINQYHEDGYGFGVIAQALWMSAGATEDGSADATLAGLILEAKTSGDYSKITLADGTLLTLPDGTVPSNWGQFKKAFSDKKHNLGVIVSGHADSPDDELDQQEHGKGKDKDKNKDKNKDKDNGHGKNNKP